MMSGKCFREVKEDIGELTDQDVNGTFLDSTYNVTQGTRIQSYPPNRFLKTRLPAL
jgi:hypothetical protein